MIILFSDGYWDTKILTMKMIGIKHKGHRPCTLFIGVDEIVEEFEKHATKVEDEKFISYMVSHLVPAIDGDIFCIVNNKRYLMNTAKQVEYVVNLVLDRYSVR